MISASSSICHPVASVSLSSSVMHTIARPLITFWKLHHNFSSFRCRLFCFIGCWTDLSLMWTLFVYSNRVLSLPAKLHSASPLEFFQSSRSPISAYIWPQYTSTSTPLTFRPFSLNTKLQPSALAQSSLTYSIDVLIGGCWVWHWCRTLLWLHWWCNSNENCLPSPFLHE